MIPKPQPTEVKRLASQAINLREKENISMPEAIETVCTQSFVPTTDTPLTIGNVQAYLHLLQDAVTEEVGAQNAVTEEVDAQKGGSEDTTLYIS